jgi:MFS family permease
MFIAKSLEKRISQQSDIIIAIFGGLCGLGVYACMYAFRKPFAAAAFSDSAAIWGINYKSILVISQVLGYMCAKFLGIKIIAEQKNRHRAWWIIGLILFAEVCLIGFAFLPTAFRPFCLFLNGVPLGLIWGLVFSYLEGRRFTEIMGVTMATTFIFASGFSKDIALYLMQNGVSDYAMPAATGALFFLPLCLFTWLLQHIPAPNEADIAQRTLREPMNLTQRWTFFKQNAFGLIALILVYMGLTAYRDFRDNFMVDIWKEINGSSQNIRFSSTEIPASLLVLLILSTLVFVKNNRKALLMNHLIIMMGLIMTLLVTFLFQKNLLPAYWWMLLTGVGTYIAYIPFNTLIFDRMIAALRQVSNVGFVMYLADAFGYLGSVAILLYKDLGQKNIQWVDFYIKSTYVLGFAGVLLMLISAWYFWRKTD